MRRQRDGLRAVDAHRAAAPADQAENRPQRRGAPGAVAAEERHHLAGVDLALDAVQYVRLAVVGVQLGDLQRRRAHAGALRGTAGADPM